MWSGFRLAAAVGGVALSHYSVCAGSFRQTCLLTADGAAKAMAACKAEADKNGWMVTIVVADAGGVPLALERRGSAAMTVDIALGKAKTAALAGKASSVYEGLINGDPRWGKNVKPKLSLLSNGYVLMEGGIPIFIDGHVVGSIGVSGVRSDQDVQIAQAGIDALMADAQCSHS
ncbi:hypothetical protein M885DRAFT_589444 [Pelagophyceae sp. CCMP2097]|nr:hypothetical protein M885DRAFT_589444 [Pelagophyceae sp. CCMP2097]